MCYSTETLRQKKDMTLTSNLFGVVVGDNVVKIYLEDDENYIHKLEFHPHWIPDLIRALADAQFFQNAKSLKHES